MTTGDAETGVLDRGHRTTTDLPQQPAGLPRPALVRVSPEPDRASLPGSLRALVPGPLHEPLPGSFRAPAGDLLAELVDRRRGGSPRGSHRARALSEAMGSPHLLVPTIHVAGTNGKTSVVRMVSALLGALGISTGDTTSPHLHRVDERIQIDGHPVDRSVLEPVCARLTAALVEAERRTGEPPTFFDAVTVAALRSFADAQVDVAVVEAGIGGAGDATAIVPSRVAVLTRIGLDHPELGADHATVAAEKAEIVQPGSIVLSARQEPAAAQVIDRVAAARGATLLKEGVDLAVVRRRPRRDGQAVQLRGLHGTRLRAVLPLHGAPQAANAALALATVQAMLATTDLDPQRLRAGFASVRVPGRSEIVRADGGPTVILDGAHDPEAVAALAATAMEQHPDPVGRRVVIFGVTGGRAPVTVLEPLRAQTDEVIVVAADTPTAAPPDLVAAQLAAAGHRARVVATVDQALGVAMDRAGADGLVVVTGSLHLVAAGRTALTLPRLVRDQARTAPGVGA